MNDADRALLAEIAERTDAYQRWLKDDGPNPDDLWQAVDDRVDLLRIVGQLMFAAERYRDALEICAAADVLSNDAESAVTINRRNIARHALRDTLAEDLADDAAAERATAGKWST